MELPHDLTPKEEEVVSANLSSCFKNNLGAANIIEKNAAGPRSDQELVPEEAIRPSMENQDHHVGRGGAGNEHHAPGHEHGHKDEKKPEKAGPTAPTGLADKLKSKIIGVFKK